MTNDPTWDWHLQNVNNYAALQPGWYQGVDTILGHLSHISRTFLGPHTDPHTPGGALFLVPIPIGR